MWSFHCGGAAILSPLHAKKLGFPLAPSGWDEAEMNHAKEADTGKSLPVLPVLLWAEMSAMSRKPVLHNDDLQLESGFRTDLLLPIHTTLFLSPNIFPVKSNVRKGHIHLQYLINPLPFPSRK